MRLTPFMSVAKSSVATMPSATGGGLAFPGDAAEGPAAAQRAFAERLQRLDRDAWKVLYLGNRRVVRGVLAGFIGYGSTVEDLTQQVFVTAATLVQTGRVVLRGDERGLRAWLVAIAQRFGCGELRRLRSARETLPADDPPKGLGPEPDPVARQVLRHARAAWQRLPDPLQVPWLLRYLERMTIDEIAEAIGASSATVKRRLAEADGRFASMAQEDPVLRDYLQNGGRP